MPEERGVEALSENGKRANGSTADSLPFSVPTATSPRSVPRSATFDHPHLFFNRELSWLDFNWRVFHQAVDERVPLLERVRFLAITATNLDEFFRKRIGGLKRQMAAGVRALSPDGRTPEEQLELILRAVRPMYRMLSELWEHELKPTLKQEAGIHIHDFASLDEAERILHRNRIEKLPVVDDAGRLRGLITVKDIFKRRQFPNAAKDEHGRLRVGAAIGTSARDLDRAAELVQAGTDVLVIDTAHGHSAGVLRALELARSKFPDTQIIAGNIGTAEGAAALAERGADAVKVGIGPGSICTTRVVTGIGVPQFTAVMEAVRGVDDNVPVIADGGVRYSGDIVKAIAAGAATVMMGSLLAGTEESPGESFLLEGRRYKTVRGMGSLSAMEQGSADRYFQAETRETRKLVPEGIEARVPYKGAVGDVLYQLVGGLRSGMGYVGCADIGELRTRPRFVRITPGGLRESHPHDVAITREAPNYHL